MRADNLTKLKDNEISFNGNTNNLQHTVSEIDAVVNKYGGSKKDELEKDLVQLVINAR